MLRKFFDAHRDGHKRGALAVCLTVIGLLALASLFTADIAPAKTVQGHGTDLPQVWVEVVARDLDYSRPRGVWVTISAHEFEIINYHTFRVQFDYEFNHRVVEIDDRGREGNTVIMNMRCRENRPLDAPDSDSNGAVFAEDASGLMRNHNYKIHAYTRIHAWKRGQGRIADDWQVDHTYTFTAR